MKNILPLAYPPITYKPAIATLFSILWPHKDDVKSWISDHYIQLVSTSDDDSINFLDFLSSSKTEIYADTPYTTPMQLDIRAHKDLIGVLSDFIELNINNGYYIFTGVNHFYLPCSQHYHNLHWCHPMLIYGYDRELDRIHIAEFINNKYTHTYVTYNDINLSMENLVITDNLPIYHYKVNLLRYDDAAYNLNLELLMQSYQDYLSGIDSFKRLDYNYRYVNHFRIYGINCYELMIKRAQQNKLDIRLNHLFYDHKVLMKIRLEYMRDILKVPISVKIINMCESLINESLVLRSIALKYGLTSNENLLIRISSGYASLKKRDEEFTNLLIKQIGQL